jgi:predicted alternative tryptophan synthase beta-subunit
MKRLILAAFIGMFMLLQTGLSQPNVVTVTNVVNVVNITNITTITRINEENSGKMSVVLPQDMMTIYSEYVVFPPELIRKLKFEAALDQRQQYFLNQQFPRK